MYCSVDLRPLLHDVNLQCSIPLNPVDEYDSSVHERTRLKYAVWNQIQDAKQNADAAVHRAAEYLAGKIMYVTDPFQMAILTYALHVSQHEHRDSAYKRLRSMGSQHKTSMNIFNFKLCMYYTSSENMITVYFI